MDGQTVSFNKSTLKWLGGGAAMAALVVTVLVGFVAWSAGTNEVKGTSLAGHISVSPVVDHLYLTIATGLGPNKDWPSYTPSSFTLPANATVVVTITDLDDATAMPAKYSKVTGTEGNAIHVSPINPANPNAVRAGTTATSLDPRTQVGHTFTIPQLGLNVPVAAHAVETFTFHTGAANACGGGQCMWHCYNPCGSGASGWGGPMSAPGFMGGSVTIA